MARVLVIDDDALVRNSFSRLFFRMGHDVVTAQDLATGELEAGRGVDIIYLDLDLPDGDGLKAIDTLAEAHGHPEVIVITGVGALYGAEKALNSKAWDYIAKPASPQLIKRSLENALQYRRQAAKASAKAPVFDRCGIMGESAALLHALESIQKAAQSSAGILISGETGTGKELIARAIHANGDRRAAPFVVVDCSNMTDTLVESVLYGHAKGAFTGAHTAHDGLIAKAHGGTLFLDEVGELTPRLQKSFLRVLQERRFRPVGSSLEQASDFRLVAATHRDLDQMARRDEFRSDLLFRIRTMEIRVPPLRKRDRDKIRLAEHFVEQHCDNYGLAGKRLSEPLQAIIDGYQWPGNVRELAGAMEAAVINAGQDPVVFPKHLPGNVRLSYLDDQKAMTVPSVPMAETNATIPNVEETWPIAPFNTYKAERDKAYFTQLILAANYDIAKASRMSGLSIASVYRHLQHAGISTKKEG